MSSCSLLTVGLDEDREYGLDDYSGAVPRWCPGCGDHAVLTAVQRVLEGEQLAPERTVFVSGIGCSSRFPHYLKTYGFHGIHGRALPVATGVKLHRPELNVFVVMGDGDCASIGAGHWFHATRYNVDMVALMLDNEVYGLTKNQTSPTSPQGFVTNTQPRGSYLPALNPIEAMLGMTNVSFVAQTADWVPAHLYETVRAAHRHRGFAFVRILQRCPQYSTKLFEAVVRDPSKIELLVHERAIDVEELHGLFKHRRRHDPGDIATARALAEDATRLRLGIFYRDESRPRYEETRRVAARSAEEKIRLLDEQLDRYAI
jgi:2-oxoglutarate/2-oxoacid ferredoxin oxidoreductase subunit beta